MSADNDAVKIKREILIHVAKLAFEDRLKNDLRKLPFVISPNNKQSYRCCVHHDRVIVKDRALAVLGFSLESRDETLELSDWARKSETERPEGNFQLTVVDEACRGCVRTHFMVTNACQGCVARPCKNNCPKSAISLDTGRSVIDSDLCINCGKCEQACPYHAIVKIPIPCEESCPVGAIQKGPEGKETIDEDKCMLCGKCVVACPFGAVMERSQVLDVISLLKGPVKPVAMVAPSVLGQFPGTLGQIFNAIKALGFSKVYEVAAGAEETAQHEAEEWAHIRAKGQTFMTTSCCPAYVRAAKNIPELLPFVSNTPSPLGFISVTARSENPEAARVFIGPCIAKRWEARDKGTAEHVLTFEELGALFVAKGVELASLPDEDPNQAGSAGRGFALSGGVAKAILAKGAQGVDAEIINGLNKKTINLLKIYSKGKGPKNFIEVMSCEGGCAGGPGTVCSLAVALKHYKS